MSAKFISHPDFASLEVLNVFHKEKDESYETPKHAEELKNKHVLYRRSIVIRDTRSLTLRISADDYYKLYINGALVTMGPAPSYPHAYNYNEIDVTPFVKEGENTFAVHTYYQGLVNRVWVSADYRQMLFFELRRGEDVLLESDGEWKCAYHTGYTPTGIIGYDTAYTECFDSTSPEVSFMDEDFDDSLWGYAAVRENADYTLVKQDTLQIDIYKTEAKRVQKTDFGFFIDFEQEMVGYLNVSARGGRGSVVTLRYGEELCDDGSVRYDMRCNSKYEEKWILSGGDDRLDNFDYKAFRYAEIHIPKGCEIGEISMTVRHYPFEQRHSYGVERPELARILELCVNTVKYGVQESFVDCPTREKGQYLGDVAVAARAHAILTGDVAMIRKAILDFCNSSFICPGIMAVSSSALMQEIADYSLALPAAVWWVYRIDGDLDFLNRTEPYLTDMYSYFLRFAGEDLLLRDLTEKNNIVDWPTHMRDGYRYPDPAAIGKGLHNVLNAFWYSAVTALDSIYAALGHEKTGIAEQIKSAYHRTFYNSELGLFTDNPTSSHAAMHSNVLPLLFGICDGNERLKKNIVDRLRERRLTSVGTYMSYYALAALMREGEAELAEELACDADAWLNMLSEGATTAFEVWGKEKKHNTSLFHPWSVAPLIIFNGKYPVY